MKKVNKFISIKQFYYQDIKDSIDSFANTDQVLNQNKRDSYDINIQENPQPFFKGVITTEELKQLYKYLGYDIKQDGKKV